MKFINVNSVTNEASYERLVQFMVKQRHISNTDFQLYLISKTETEKRILVYGLNSLKCFRHNYSSFWLINIWLRLVNPVAIMKKSMWPVGVTVKSCWWEHSLRSVREEGSVWRSGQKRAVDGSVSVQSAVSGLTSVTECHRQSDNTRCIWNSLNIDCVKISKLWCRIVW
jgi:hypothetical protein